MSRKLATDETISMVHKAVIADEKTTYEIVNTLNSGTAKEKHLISNECDIIFECKVCRNLFRTLPSFIAHKQFYCLQCIISFDILNEKSDEVVCTYSKQPFSGSETLFRKLKKESITNNEGAVNLSTAGTSSVAASISRQFAALKDIQYTHMKEKGIKTDQFSNSQVYANSLQNIFRRNQSDTPVKISYEADLDSEKRKKINMENQISGKPVLAKSKLDGDKKIMFDYTSKKNESTVMFLKQSSAASAESGNSNAGKHRMSVRFSRRIEKMNKSVVKKLKKTESQKKHLKNYPVKKNKRKCFMEVMGDFKRRKCRKCDVIYTSIKRLENHIQIRHADVKTGFVCPCCPFRMIFDCLSDVVRHLQNDHHLRKKQISILQQNLKEKTWNKKDAANLQMKLFGSGAKQAEDNSFEVTLKPEKASDSNLYLRVSAPEAGHENENSDIPVKQTPVDVNQEKMEIVKVYQKKLAKAVKEKKENSDVPICPVDVCQGEKETMQVQQTKPGETEDQKKENVDVQPKLLNSVLIQLKKSDLKQRAINVHQKQMADSEFEKKKSFYFQHKNIVEIEKLGSQPKQSNVEEGRKKEIVDVQTKNSSVNEEQDKNENMTVQPMKSFIVKESETKLKLPTKLYLCPFCQKSNQFTYFSGLIIHLRTIHSLKRHQIYQMRQKLRENIQVENPFEVFPEAIQADKEYLDCPRCLKSVKKKILKEHFEQCAWQTLKLDSPKQQPGSGSRLSRNPVASKVVTLLQAAKIKSQPARVGRATSFKQSKVEDRQQTKAKADTYILPATKSYDVCQYSNLSKMANNKMLLSKAKSARKKSLPLEDNKTATRKHCIPKFQEIWVAKTPGKPSEVVKSRQHYMKAKDKKLSEDLSGEDDEEISQFVTLEPLQCKLCRKHFTFIQHYKRHVALCETNQKFKEIVDMDNLRCFLCSSVFSNTQHLKRHASKHLGFFRFKCKMCNFTAFYQSEIKQHLSTHKTHKVDMSKWESYIKDLDPDTQLKGYKQKIKNYNVAIKSRRKSGTQVGTTKRSSKTVEVPPMPVKTDKSLKFTRTSKKSGKRSYRRVKNGKPNKKRAGKAPKIKDASTKISIKRDAADLEVNFLIKNSLLSSGERTNDISEGVDAVNISTTLFLKKMKFDEVTAHLTPEIYTEKQFLATKKDLSLSAQRTNSFQKENVKAKTITDSIQKEAGSQDEEISTEEPTRISNSADTVLPKVISH